MRKNIFVMLFICMFFNTIGTKIKAQISEGGKPVSFSLEIPTYEIPTITMLAFDVDSVIKAEAMIKEPKPFRFGFAIDVDIDLKKSGLLHQLPNGDKIWLLKIHSKNAFSINLIYDRFILGKDSKLFVYNEDKSMVLGAFTAENANNQYNEFATDLVHGNTIVLEYYEPEYSKEGVVNINKVIHGYVNTFSDGYGASADCNIDVNCPIGNNWENEKRAVSMMLINDNSAFCTGCLINNTEQDYTPYYLTANHCLIGGTNTWIFRFKYWNANCGSGTLNNWQSITGATLRASHAPTDFALLELNTVPPANYQLYYAGWDRTTTPAQNVTAIHHPRGDAMKISNDQHPVVSTPWYSGASNHWKTTFEQGIVQHGSSGSPLFNQTHRIVGQLHGNQNNQCGSPDNDCHCNQSPIGEYGRFDISWTGGGTNSSSLSGWLDPNNTGATILDGIEANYACTYISISSIQPPQPSIYRRVICNEINIQNATVPAGTTLILDATDRVTINAGFKVEAGARFIVR